MEVLKKTPNFRICRSVEDVEEQCHLKKSKTKPTHHEMYHQQRQQVPQQLEQNKQDHNNKNEKKMRISRSPVVSAGCFPVYVGPENEKQRFVVKAENANHPLFQILLEEAESKYGLQRQGPISLPCDVDLFYKVMAEIDMGSSSFKIQMKNMHMHLLNIIIRLRSSFLELHRTRRRKISSYQAAG